MNFARNSLEEIGKLEWVLVGLAFVFGLIFFYKLQRWWRGFLGRRQFKHGNKGEFKARKFLEKNGFQIIDEQTNLTSTISLNDKPFDISMRADYLVERNGKRAIVEVKTGKRAIEPLNIHTRRQILEYACFYDVDEVYLFDAENMDLVKYEYPQFEIKRN